MSHVVSIKTKIQDLDALDAACAELGLELVRGQQTYKWYGTWVGDHPLPEGFTEESLGKCSHAIRIPGNPQAYEIGVVQDPNDPEAHLLLWDFWRGGYGLERVAGKDCRNLVQEYVFAVTEQQMGHEWSIARETTPEGEMLLTLTQ